MPQDDFSCDMDSDHEDYAPTNTHHSHKNDQRKSNKPIMEKRRRARINNCLNDLKGILLEAMRKDPARHSKLEKADILELTVRHLQNIQRNQLAIAMASDPTVLFRFKNGFAECATEVSRYLSKLDGVEDGMKSRVSVHLTSCVNGLQQVNPPSAPSIPGVGFRYGSDVPPFMPFTPPATATLIPPSNLTPPGDLNNNKEPIISIIRPTPINPTLFTRPPSPPVSASDPVDYSLRNVKMEPKESMWRPW